MACMDLTAGWAVNARMEESAIVSVAVIVLQDGGDRAVRSLVGIPHNRMKSNTFHQTCDFSSLSFIFILSILSFLPLSSDRAPQILDLEGNLEWNRNSSPKIFCSATGNPLPSHDSIKLRSLDGAVLQVGTLQFQQHSCKEQ